jgi:uncharacterized protein (TIGR03000 family)
MGFGSSGGSSGGGHASLFSHGSSGGGHASLFSHGSSGGGHSLFSHGSSGGSSGGGHASLFSHGSSGGGKHASLFSHGSSGGGHASLFSHGSSGGSSGGSKHHSLFSHGSSGGSSGGSKHGSLFSHGSSGGSSGGSYGSAGGGYLSSNVVAPSNGYLVANNSFVAPVAPATTGVAYLNVSVPADAKVYLQDQLMTNEGTDRRFVTPQLVNGVQHVYTVKVEVVRNGQTISKTAQAVVAAGQQVGVAVAFDAENQKELVATTGL